MSDHGLSAEQLAELKASWAKEEANKEPEIELPKYRTELSEYKGNQMIAVFLGDKRIIGFGLKKAAAVVDCIDAIKAFVDSQMEKG